MRILRSPALHMVLIGALLFGGEVWRRGGLAGERPRLVIPPHRVALTFQILADEGGRPLTIEERRSVLDRMVDQEVLYQYALEVGAMREPVVRRRLAQIARFVDENPHELGDDEALAERAEALGLHHGDLVVRNILTDAARRLIRGVALVREPRPEALEAWFEDNRERFRRPPETDMSLVHVDGIRHGDAAGDRARALLDRIRREGLTPEEARALGDETFLPDHLDFESPADLDRRFGRRFEEALRDPPVGRWLGPIRSRYGHHLVWVHAHRAATVPPLEEIRDEVVGHFLQEMADAWLEYRLAELKTRWEIVVPEIHS